MIIKFILVFDLIWTALAFSLTDLMKPDLFVDEICSFNSLSDPKLYIDNTTKQTNVTCICAPEYTTLNSTTIRKINNIPVQCNYRKKRRFITLFFSIFLPFGIDHFYLGNYFIFLGIILACCFVTFGNCYRFAVTTNQDYLKNRTNLFFVVLAAFALIFWILNIVLVITGFYTDSNGVEMADDLNMLFFASN